MGKHKQREKIFREQMKQCIPTLSVKNAERTGAPSPWTKGKNPLRICPAERTLAHRRFFKEIGRGSHSSRFVPQAQLNKERLRKENYSPSMMR
jgi:hypothetical protein